MNLADRLRTFPALAALPPTELELLEHAFSVCAREDGFVLIREGAAADAMHLILAGEVEVVCQRPETPDGFGVVKTMGPGELVGLLGLIDLQPRSATCRAKGPVTIASLPRSAADLLFMSHAPLSYAFRRVLAEQLAQDAHLLYRLLADALWGSVSPEQAYQELSRVAGAR